MPDVLLRRTQTKDTMPSPIPMSPDVAELVGDYAERVDNRSLLLDKFVFPKQWVEGNFKRDEATRWSLLRLTSDGASVLRSDLDRAQKKLAKGGHDSKKNESAKMATELLPKISQTASPPSDIYKLRERHSRRMIELLAANENEDAVWFTARLESRLAINLADGLIENAGICLDRLFGMPYIPGSALKGNARHAALDSLDQSDPVFLEIFGNTEQKGGVSFVNAYPIHGLDENILEVDITNVHTPSYYSGKTAGNPRELQNEKPRPNPFPVVRKGTVFVFLIILNTIGRRFERRQTILERAKYYLETALTQNGIGAKTSSGYGWFSLTPELDEEIRIQADEDASRKQAQIDSEKERMLNELKEAQRLASMCPVEREKETIQQMDPQVFAAYVLEAEEKSLDQQLALLEVLKTSEKKDLLKKYRKGKKPVDGERWTIVTRLAKEHGVTL